MATNRSTEEPPGPRRSIDPPIRSARELEPLWRGEAPRWVLLVAIAGAIVAVQLVGRTRGAMPLLVWLIFFVVLDIVALRWGADSRDGGDWKPLDR